MFVGVGIGLVSVGAGGGTGLVSTGGWADTLLSTFAGGGGCLVWSVILSDR
jgi:hypothetical protein